MRNIDDSENSRISMIAAISAHSRAIGRGGDLLYKGLKADMEHFKTLTSGHAVIMGRKTWESLPAAFRPLPNRTNIVVTSNPDAVFDGAVTASSLAEAIEKARETDTGEVFIIGGGTIYTEGMQYANRLYITLVTPEEQGDVFFPEYEQEFPNVIGRECLQDNGHDLVFETRERTN